MMSPLDFLAKLTIVLLLGLFVGLLSKKLKLPSMLMLILTGAILSKISFNGMPVFDFSDNFLISASLLTLVMILFKDSSSFSFHDIDTYSEFALKMAILFVIFNMLFLSIATYFLFDIHSMLLCLLFAAVMSGTDPGTVLTLFQTKSNKITEILKFESVINTPLIVLIPFIILDLMELNQTAFSDFLGHFYPFMQQIITGIGTGVVVGIIVFRHMKRFYSDKLSPLLLITASLLTYVLSEKLGGNGVLAVTVLGVFFGSYTIKKKQELLEFSKMLTNTLEILVFILIGFLIPLNLSFEFIWKSLLLFFSMVLIRFLVIQIVFLNDHVNLKEKIFMSLNCAKGIAVAVVVFLLTNRVLEIPILSQGKEIITEIRLIDISGSQTILDLIVLFILYSIILSSVAARFSQHFIRLKVEE